MRDKEKFYQEEIFPLMAEIFEKCRERQMPMLCVFEAGETTDGEELYISSSVVADVRADSLLGILMRVAQGYLNEPEQEQS